MISPESPVPVIVLPEIVQYASAEFGAITPTPVVPVTTLFESVTCVEPPPPLPAKTPAPAPALVSRRLSKVSQFLPENQTAPFAFAIVARPEPYEPKVIGAVDEPERAGISVVSPNVEPPSKRPVSPGRSAWLFARPIGRQGVVCVVPAALSLRGALR